MVNAILHQIPFLHYQVSRVYTRTCLRSYVIYIDVSHLQLPPKLKRKGRPKGSQLTVIGLPKKKGRCDSKPIAFIKRHPKEKERGMISYM